MLFKLLYLSRKGIHICHASANQIERLKKKKKVYLKLGMWQFSLKEQLEIFEFLSLYYSEGENVYGLLLKYQQFANKRIKGICRYVLGQLRSGKELSQIFKDSGLFSEEINSFFMVLKLAGASKSAFEKIVLKIKSKLKTKKELVKRSIYPAMLIFSGVSMIVFVSYSIIPNFLFFFQDSGTAIPFMLQIISKDNLWRLGLVAITFCMSVYGVYKLIPLKIKASIPVVNYLYRAKFQVIFWQICSISVDNEVSLEELIADYLSLDKKGLTGYYLSTILSRISRGLSFDKAIDIPLMEKRHLVMTTMATDNQRKKQLYQNFLVEAEESNDETQVILANFGSSIALVFIGALILIIGYVMLIPLSQISEII